MADTYRCAACGATFADRGSGEAHSSRFGGGRPHVVVPSGTPSSDDAQPGPEVRVRPSTSSSAP
jgi:hypothetical protein